MRSERGSRIISVNGSAARRAAVGDLLMIAAFSQVHEVQVSGFAPKIVFVNELNCIKEIRSQLPVQTAEGMSLSI
jgi:aspartate 1-decarboxylase